MTIFVVITYSIEFSNQVIKYFQFQNPPVHSKLSFLPLGVDQGSEKEILEQIKAKIADYKKTENLAIFSDVGLPTKIAKRIVKSISGVKVYHSKGSLIENGFLTYMMLNTSAPDQIITEILDVEFDKS